VGKGLVEAKLKLNIPCRALVFLPKRSLRAQLLSQSPAFISLSTAHSPMWLTALIKLRFEIMLKTVKVLRKK
jgi:hypothetical protein